MSPTRLAVLALGTLALVGCTLPMNGLTVHKLGLSTTRPENTITGSEGNSPWQTYTVDLPSRLTRTLAGMDSTFHLSVTDCRHNDAGRIESGQVNTDGLISIEDVYVGGVTLNGSSTVHAKAEAIKGPLVRGVAYVSKSRIKDVPELCFRALGGSMMGVGFKSNIVRVPS
jgi:hypothetical protein